MSAPPPFADTSPSVPPEDEDPQELPAITLLPAVPPAAASAEPPPAQEPAAFSPAAAYLAMPVEPPAEPGEDNAITSLQRAMIGPLGAAHYLPVFARFEAADRAGPGWNWAASLCTLNWLVFRRLWGPALAYLAALAAGALLVFGLGRTVFHLSHSEEISLLVAMATLAFLVPGGLGDAWMYRQYRRRSADALAQAPTLKEACALLARQASARPRLLGMVVANGVLAAAAFTGWSVLHAPGATTPVAGASDLARRDGGSVSPATSPAPTAPTAIPATPSSAGSEGGATSTLAATSVVQQAVQPPVTPPAVPLPPVAPVPAPGTLAPGETLPGADLRAAAPTVRITLPAAPPPATGATGVTGATGPTNTDQADTPPIVATPASAPSTRATPEATAPVADAMPAAAPPAPTWYPDPARMQAYVPRRAVADAAVPPSLPAQATAGPGPGAARASPPIAAKRPVASAATARASAPVATTRTAGAGAGAGAGEVGRYVINVGLFGDPTNARRVLASLHGAKVRVLVEELDMPNGRRTRVRAGPYATKAQADAAAARIRALQLDAVVVRQ